MVQRPSPAFAGPKVCANAIVIACCAEFRHFMVLIGYIPVPPVRLWRPFLTLPRTFIYRVASNYDV